MSTDALGDRMKAYEAAESDRRFMPLLPIYARIDGRSFSRFTAGLARPFDLAFQEAMILTTKALVEHTHARIGYTQSDEISLVWQQDRYDSDVFFGGRVQEAERPSCGQGGSTDSEAETCTGRPQGASIWQTVASCTSARQTAEIPVPLPYAETATEGESDG